MGHMGLNILLAVLCMPFALPTVSGDTGCMGIGDFLSRLNPEDYRLIIEIQALLASVVPYYARSLPALERLKDDVVQFHQEQNVQDSWRAAAATAGAVMSFTPAAPYGLGVLAMSSLYSIKIIYEDRAFSQDTLDKVNRMLKPNEDVEMLREKFITLSDLSELYSKYSGYAKEKATSCIFTALTLSSYQIGIFESVKNHWVPLSLELHTLKNSASSFSEGIPTFGVDDILKAFPAFYETLSTFGPFLDCAGVLADLASLAYNWKTKHDRQEDIENAIEIIKNLNSFKENLDRYIDTVQGYRLN